MNEISLFGSNDILHKGSEGESTAMVSQESFNQGQFSQIAATLYSTLASRFYSTLNLNGDEILQIILKKATAMKINSDQDIYSEPIFLESIFQDQSIDSRFHLIIAVVMERCKFVPYIVNHLIFELLHYIPVKSSFKPLSPDSTSAKVNRNTGD